MPKNPERKTRGGDVSGETETDNQWGVGRATTVAEASFDPGYEIEESMENFSMADVKQGYCSYGVEIGEKRGKDFVGGR